MDYIGHGVTKSRTPRSDFQVHFRRVKGNPKPKYEDQSPDLHGLAFKKQAQGSLSGSTLW